MQRLILSCLCLMCLPGVSLAQQFRDPPAETGQFAFLLGDWKVAGKFRTPDAVNRETRAAWYVAGDSVLMRFDGRTWKAFPVGADAVADSMRDAIGASEPAYFDYETDRRVYYTQNKHALTIDDGAIGGATYMSYQPEIGKWIWKSLHAPTSAWSEGEAVLAGERMVSTGSSEDRRGKRLLRTVYETVSQDHYRVITDASFDEGRNWIRGQLVLDVKRRAGEKASKP